MTVKLILYGDTKLQGDSVPLIACLSTKDNGSMCRLRQQVLRYLTWDLICEQSHECYVYTYEK